MKKLLILTGILALSITAFAAKTTNYTGEAVEKLEVKAKVIKPLTVTTTPLDFGTVVQGQNAQAENGKISIDGEPSNTVKIQLSTDGSNYSDYTTTSYNVDLKTGNGGTNEVMTANLTVGNSASPEGTVALDTNGKHELNVSGNVATAENQVTGDYKGYLHVKAKYNGVPNA